MLAKRADRLTSKTKAYGVLPWLEIFTVVLGFIAQCRKPPNPTPNPTPSPTPAQSQAWDDAVTLKFNADQSVDDRAANGYSGKAFNKMRTEIRQKNRKDGTPIKKHEADIAAAKAFDDTRSSSLHDLYSDALEARNHA